VEDEAVAKRPQGTGSLFIRTDSRGREAWYAQWRVDGRLVKRRLGFKRAPGAPDGLTKSDAEGELRRLIESMTVIPKAMDIAEAGARWLVHLEAVGRRKSTLMDYESAVRIHLVPFFDNRPIAKITAADVERFMVSKRAEGRSPKSVRNWLGVLHSLLTYAEKREWILSNPARKVVRMDLLRPSGARATVCEFKGVARYLDAVIDGRLARAVAWSYLDPTPAYEALRDHVAFYAGRVDAAWLGDELVQAQQGDFYGGWITSDLVGQPFKGPAGTLAW
jgi:hypothetical protein